VGDHAPDHRKRQRDEGNGGEDGECGLEHKRRRSSPWLGGQLQIIRTC
jgi:hypothetical protein